jgi:hypothetical protein
MTKKIADKLTAEGFELVKLRYPLGNYRPRKQRGYCKYLAKRKRIYACTLMEKSKTFKQSMLSGHSTLWCPD